MARARTPRPKAVAPPIQKCNVWDGRSDLTGLLAAEKYDGHRVYWDGSKLLTRRGRVLDNAPSWFTAGLPSTPLDGELWAGRGSLAKVTAATQATIDPEPFWRGLRLAIFDAPTVPGPLRERLGPLHEMVQGSRYSFVVPHWLVASTGHVLSDLGLIEADGGEGVVVRAPDSHYTPGYSDEWLKVKPYIDGEAIVAEHLSKDGIVSGLLMEMPSGETFRITRGVSPIMTPPVGSILTFRCEALSARGIPCLGTTLIGMRTDITRDEIAEPRRGSPARG